MSYDTIIDKTAAIIREGKVILYPTDTIWGLGCDARNEKAVQKIYTLKGRRPEKAFLVLVNSIEMLKQYVVDIHPRVETLLVYHNRPLTLIYNKAKNLPNVSISEDGSIGIRISQDPFCKELISKCGGPIISTSANISEEPAPRFYREISEKIRSQVDHIVNYRQDDEVERQASVIATFDLEGEIVILRE